MNKKQSLRFIKYLKKLFKKVDKLEIQIQSSPSSVFWKKRLEKKKVIDYNPTKIEIK